MTIPLSDSPASSFADAIAFDPVELRARHDGWTPACQRDFLEALAESGIVRHAAAAVGMTEQSVGRLRRRADAAAFDVACDAALRIGARRLRAIAFERAVEGEIRRHYYHGELISEERVHDNRLLISLLGRFEHLFVTSPAAVKVERAWDAQLAGLADLSGDRPPPPDLDAPPTIVVQGPGDRRTGDADVWCGTNGKWWTSLPPPHDFRGKQRGSFGDEFYERTLVPAELAVIAAREDAAFAAAATRRDRFFSIAPAARSLRARVALFSPKGSEPSEPSAPGLASADPDDPP